MLDDIVIVFANPVTIGVVALGSLAYAIVRRRAPSMLLAALLLQCALHVSLNRFYSNVAARERSERVTGVVPAKDPSIYRAFAVTTPEHRFVLLGNVNLNPNEEVFVEHRRTTLGLGRRDFLCRGAVCWRIKKILN